MNHFDEVDFSECHSEKVISFFCQFEFEMNEVQFDIIIMIKVCLYQKKIF